jgi:hypothetical protein
MREGVYAGRWTRVGVLRIPKGTTRFRHSSLIDRTKRSACALQFGAAAGVRITRTPTVLSTSSIAWVRFGSRSQIRMRPSRSTSSDSPTRPRMACTTKALSGCGVDPSTHTRRVCSSMTNAV